MTSRAHGNNSSVSNTERICAKCGMVKDSARCRECDRQYARRYREEHREKCRERCRRWYEQNREKASKYARRRREQNPELARELDRKPRTRNAEKMRRYRRKYYQLNTERWAEYNRQRRARKLEVLSDLTPEQWERIQEVYDHRCAYCGKKQKLTMDHVIPLSKGGSHSASNIVPACRSCNSRKGPRHPHIPVQMHLIT